MKKFLKENVKLVAIGIASGAVNGFFGGGAGLVLVPLLKKACGIKAKSAHATSVAITFILSIATFTVYLIKGTLSDIRGLPYFIIGSTVGGILGGFALKKISPKALKIIFSLFLIYSGVRMILG